MLEALLDIDEALQRGGIARRGRAGDPRVWHQTFTTGPVARSHSPAPAQAVSMSASPVGAKSRVPLERAALIYECPYRFLPEALRAGAVLAGALFAGAAFAGAAFAGVALAGAAFAFGAGGF